MKERYSDVTNIVKELEKSAENCMNENFVEHDLVAGYTASILFSLHKFILANSFENGLKIIIEKNKTIECLLKQKADIEMLILMENKDFVANKRTCRLIDYFISVINDLSECNINDKDEE